MRLFGIAIVSLIDFIAVRSRLSADYHQVIKVRSTDLMHPVAATTATTTRSPKIFLKISQSPKYWMDGPMWWMWVDGTKKNLGGTVNFLRNSKGDQFCLDP